jgi:hypothetical protein
MRKHEDSWMSPRPLGHCDEEEEQWIANKESAAQNHDLPRVI